MTRAAGVTDLDEYGRPVGDRYKRLGAGADDEREEGLYVRFEPGFGLNVHIGLRIQRYDPGYGYRQEWTDIKEYAMGIQGWERLCELVDEWRARAGDDDAE